MAFYTPQQKENILNISKVKKKNKSSLRKNKSLAVILPLSSLNARE